MAHLVAGTVALLFLSAEPLWAALFPRGPGFYFNPWKIVFFLIVYLTWVRISGWVGRDLLKTENEEWWWNPLFLAVGVVSFSLIWLLPIFWLPWLFFIVAFAAASWWYVTVRNELVDPEAKVLTEAHIRELIRQYLRWDLRNSEVVEEEDNRPAVSFIPRSRSPGKHNDSDDTVARVQGSKGYRMAEDLVLQALQLRATDIHLEPTKELMTVRYRIDGIMTNQQPFSLTMGTSVINIFKVIANLDISERRKAQDGGFSAEVDERPVEFRVATAGSVVGEKMVMRVLDSTQKQLDLTSIGMREKLRGQVHGIITEPHGMFLVCGPTGSGKSSTLYACLNEIDRTQLNIITIENPVEYRLDDITQIEINPKMGKTFAGELRSILRQDPDVILVGEIRDKETAEIACQAAQTGHMVYSTLHANDCVTAVTRLIDLGIEPFMLASSVSGVLGQRLMRLLCPACKVKYKPDMEKLKKAGLPVEKIKYFYRPPNEDEKDEEEACSTCGGTGYFKRTGIFELLVFNDRIRNLIKQNPNVAAIRQEGIKGGLQLLYQDGLRLVIEGKASLQELMRVSK